MKNNLQQQLKDHNLARAWRIHNFIFAQDWNEDGVFYIIHKNGKLEEIYQFPVIIFQNGKHKEKVTLEGMDFMENGKLVFGKDI